MGAKWVELLREIAPRVQSITVIFNPDTAPFARMFLPSMEAARPSAQFELIQSPVRSERDLERAVAAAGNRSHAGLVVLPDSFLNSRREMVVALTAEQRLPAIHSVSEFARSGGLIAYGIDRADLFRRSGAQRNQSGRLAGSAANLVRAGCEHQDCQGTRPRSAANAARPRRRGDRVKRCSAIVDSGL